MKTSTELFPVSFQNDTIYLIEHNNEAYTAVKPIVTNLGLDWGAQFTKIKRFRERLAISDIATTYRKTFQDVLATIENECGRRLLV